MFILNADELSDVGSQFVTPSYSIFGGSYPMAFTEPGVAMLSSVLRSKRAIEINIMIIRIFILMRKAITTNNNLELKIHAIENELSDHSTQLKILFDQLSHFEEKDSDAKIGFKTD